MDVTSNSAGADSHDASTELRVRKRSADGMKRGSTHSRKKATAADNAAANAGGPIYDKVVLPAPDNAAVGDRTSIYDVLKPVQQSHEAYAMISHNQNAQYRASAVNCGNHPSWTKPSRTRCLPPSRKLSTGCGGTRIRTSPTAAAEGTTEGTTEGWRFAPVWCNIGTTGLTERTERK